MKIAKIYPYRFRNDRHFQFYADFVGFIEAHQDVKQKIAALYATFLALYQKEDAVLKKIVKSSLTAKIQELDRARDDTYTGMREINAATLKHHDPQVRDAAARLDIVFNTYGNVAKKPLDEETASITNILQEFEGQYASDIAKVGILPWVVELKARNIAFINLMKDRYEETADKLDVELKEIRAQVDAAFFAIREQINALALVEGGAIYDELIKKVNVIITKYNRFANISKRGKKGEEVEVEQAEGGADE